MPLNVPREFPCARKSAAATPSSAKQEMSHVDLRTLSVERPLKMLSAEFYNNLINLQVSLLPGNSAKEGQVSYR